MHGEWRWIHPVLVCLAVLALMMATVNFSVVKRALVGRPMKSRELNQAHTKLMWLVALPILAADLYSSVAYGPEAGMTELDPLGAAAKWLVLPITTATVLLLCILIVSYMMGVIAYPSGGGAYAIAKDNFRRPWVSLLAASALLVDYVLTVAVSVSSGIQTMASSYPALTRFETTLSVACIVVILLVNLRGVSESAKVFSLPTLFFMVCMLFLIGVGFVHEARLGPSMPAAPPFGSVPRGLTVLLLLKAFSSACSSLTGIETISNAVPIFREGKNGALKAYAVLGAITSITLLGFAYLLYREGIVTNPHNTMLSELVGRYFGHGPIYQVIIWATLVVLILAANSTFTGFPQLAALVANDGFLPRALKLRGDRLGYSNGMIVLATLATLLVEVFHAQTNALIPLYSIGVFVAFTLAQLGLVKYWLKTRDRGWRVKLVINAIGVVVTTVVCFVVAVTKFTSGAWMVLVVIPLMISIALKVHKHYEAVAKELHIDLQVDRPKKHRVVAVVLVSGIHRVAIETISYAQSTCEHVLALYIGFDDESIERMEQKWQEWGSPCRLVAVKNEYRSLLHPLSRLIRRLEEHEGGKPDHIQLIIGQFIPKRWWENLLHVQTSLLIRAWMIRHKDVVVVTVPYHLQS
ncbi:APC family permease [Alicyclobacillus cycloheptanicus]|uniref:Amino acid transporter n=1 Tax=Alicyclobacillus cycloheptanicus TaxID=1457 RepID=A0ABT9XGG9_9BACL|nr:APC family permease [Alicyclobacillus cycloheptanicus]MDQ0189404.1 amino acid transporter [Alicyclobacillus cycloheptanicus]WDM02278.1 APC family permease [Alicyclobacillus cycloheptanicus]